MCRSTNRLVIQTAILGGLLNTAMIGGVAIAEESVTTASQTRQYDISAGSLSRVLSEFAGQAGILLSADATLTTGKKSSGLNGQYSVDQALRQLLQRAGIDFNISGSSVTLVAGNFDQSIKTLDTMRIRGSVIQETAYGPVDGYVAKRSATGTKTDTPLIEIPRSISVVTSDQIANQNMKTISEALRYTPGVMTEARGLDKTRPFIGIRGFYHRDATLVFRDGMLGSPFSSLLHPNIDLYGLERLEVLKGPASVLYGQGAPGGMVVTVTKRPKEDFFAEMEGFAGSFKQKGGKFDVSGPIDDQKKHLFRVTGSLVDGESQIDALDDNKAFISAAYTWRPSDDTSLTLMGHYQDVDSFEVTSLPDAVVGMLPNSNGKVSRSTFVGVADHQFNDSKENSLAYIFEHKLNENITLKQSVRKESGELYGEGTYIDSLQADNRTVSRGGYTNNVEIDSISTDTNISFNIDSGVITQTILAGIDYRDASTDQYGTCCFDVDSIDIYSPTTTAYTPGPVGYSFVNEVTQAGFYLQDQIKFSNSWVFNLGLRYDDSESKNKDKFTGEVTKSSDNATTFQAGFVRLLENGLAPYISYSESFQPQSGLDFSGNTFDPTTGEQFELGVKYQPKNSQTLITASAYQITRQNVRTSDPDPIHIGFDVQKGEVESRGVEFEVKMAMGDNVDLIAGYSYTDTEVTKSNEDDKGKSLSGIPKHLASLWMDYTFNNALDGLVLGGGVRYVGESYRGSDAGVDLNNTPSRTLADISARYHFQDNGKGAYVKLNVSNLLDEYYVASCGSNSCYVGAERTVKLSAGYRW